MADENIIGQHIKEMRLKKGLTQKQFADSIGITGASVMNYEKGVKLPPLDTILKMSKVLEVSLDWICGRDNDTLMNPPKTYADILRGLVMATRGVRSSIYESEYDNAESEVSVSYSDEAIKSIIIKWNSVKRAYDSNAIDDDLYSLWIEREYKKLSEYKLNDEADAAALLHANGVTSSSHSPSTFGVNYDDLPF